MVEISRISEDAAAQSRRTADLYVSCQVLSRFLPRMDRCRDIGMGIARGWIYGALGVPDSSGWEWPAPFRWIHTEGAPLVYSWSVIAYGPGLSMTLLAREVQALDGAGRYYEGFYTFRPEVADQLSGNLRLGFPEDLPVPRRPEELRW